MKKYLLSLTFLLCMTAHSLLANVGAFNFSEPIPRSRVHYTALKMTHLWPFVKLNRTINTLRISFFCPWSFMDRDASTVTLKENGIRGVLVAKAFRPGSFIRKPLCGEKLHAEISFFIDRSSIKIQQNVEYRHINCAYNDCPRVEYVKENYPAQLPALINIKSAEVEITFNKISIICNLLQEETSTQSSKKRALQTEWANNHENLYAR